MLRKVNSSIGCLRGTDTTCDECDKVNNFEAKNKRNSDGEYCACHKGFSLNKKNPLHCSPDESQLEELNIKQIQNCIEYYSENICKECLSGSTNYHKR